MKICLSTATLLALLVLLANTGAATPIPVVTYHYDNARVGANSSETVLTPANVNVKHFGKLFSIPVDGSTIWAQPLYVPSLQIPGLGTRNVLYVATQHNSLYAFDADTGATLWLTKLGPYQPKNSCMPEYDAGVMGTPVVDLSTNTIYLDAGTLRNATALHELHALDITTGKERSFSPIIVTGSVRGSGYGNIKGVVTFSPQNQRQRPALLLDNGIVYVGFTTYCDHDFSADGHGWLFAYNASNLQQTGVFVTSPNGYGSGIWASGGGPSADTNHNLYFATANGDFNANQGKGDYGESVIKLSSKVLSLLDYFTPYNQGSLTSHDADLGSGGLTLLPYQTTSPHNLMVTAGKQGVFYLINRDNLGKYNSTTDNVVEEAMSLRGQFGTPTYWHNTVYFAAAQDVPKEFSFTGGRMSKTPTSYAATAFPDPGAITVVSANGQTSGIMWAVQQGGTTSNNAVLHAYDASNLADELYNSDQAGTRDLPGKVGLNFESIIVDNGKVYVPTGQPQVSVFGLLPTQ